MLDIGWSELLVIAIVAIVVVGPKDLPKVMRTLGFYAGKVRRAAADFQRQFNEAMAESEADEVRKNIDAIRANMGTAEAAKGQSPSRRLSRRRRGPKPRRSEYLSLIMMLILGFGICFQLPVLLTLLARAGLVTSDQLKH